jgi:hypothetical protein
MNFMSKETEAMQILRLETHVDEVDKVEEVAEVCKLPVQCMI